MFTLGVVGLNLYGKTFIKALSDIKGVKVVAICPESDELLESFASSNNLLSYPNLAEMLSSEKLDAVILACYTLLHEQFAVMALNAGAHVFVDRPIAYSLEASLNMELAAKANDRILMVGHVIQFWPEYVAIREMVNNGKLGNPKAVMASRVSGLINPSWKARLLNPEVGLGVLEANIHDIDFLIGLFGQPEILYAVGRYSPIGSVDQLFSLLKFENNCLANVEADYSVPYNFPLKMYFRLVGEETSVLFNFSGALSTRDSASRKLIIFKNNSDPIELDVKHSDPYQNMLNHFIECAKEGKKPQWGATHQGFLALDTLLKIHQLINSQIFPKKNSI